MNPIAEKSSGLILQWGQTGSSSAGLYTSTLPIAFTTSFLSVVMTVRDVGSTNGYCEMQALPYSLSTFQYRTYYPTNNNYQYIALGY